ncbi:DUF7523 family protein [Natrarchaeobius chitinivorans]|uniref:Uncharacterized protein n=1 Tax=Natrarchaeobius chitinivorans TaxID=1679083 RepID=A0A3N6PC66_NATCH|nr:hypothetical protein [Natrarchaeobius chitinivorans]RQG96999.1 hypothetical protein EA473_02655 [Natrarchaeobius chitinivorans]
MSLAAKTRRAADEHPFLVAALRAGVVNYTAAARFLEVDGETDAIATALRRYADELPAYETNPRDVRVRMESGIGPVDPSDGTAFVSVAGTALGPGGGEQTAIVATGDVDAGALTVVLGRLALEDIDPVAAAVGEDSLVVVVDRLDGANAVRSVEKGLENAPRIGPE